MQTKSNTLLRYSLYYAAIIFLFISCNKKNLTVYLELNSPARQVIYAAEKFRELEQTNALVFSDSSADLLHFCQLPTKLSRRILSSTQYYSSLYIFQYKLFQN